MAPFFMDIDITIGISPGRHSSADAAPHELSHNLLRTQVLHEQVYFRPGLYGSLEHVMMHFNYR